VSDPTPVVGPADALEMLRRALKSQYHAALAMLRQAIEQCPEAVWASGDRVNPVWRIAYHTLYFTHLYLQPGEDSFRPWPSHQTWIQYMDDDPGTQDLDDFLELPQRPPRTGVPYTKTQLLEYWSVCDGMVDGGVDALDLLDPRSGFSWHVPPRSKAEQQIASIRHIQLHEAQIADRLSAEGGPRVEWVGGVGR
jgi:hypothetical protein